MHIAIIEDEQAIRQELKQLLENALYKVTALSAFHDAASAVLAKEPDLILLDLKLPEESLEVPQGKSGLCVPGLQFAGYADNRRKYCACDDTAEQES